MYETDYHIMTYECSECESTFKTLTRKRLHDCDSTIHTIQIRAKLVTNDSSSYERTRRQSSNINQNQPVFPYFDMHLKSGTLPKHIQNEISTKLDNILKENYDLWGWADTISKDTVRESYPKGKEETQFYEIGSIEATTSGQIDESFITLKEIKENIK